MEKNIFRLQSNLSTTPNSGTELTGLCGEMAVVGRANRPSGTKICGRCREVAVVGRWLLVEVRLYYYFFFTNGNSTITNHGICLQALPVLINRLLYRILIVSFSLHQVNLEVRSLTKTCWRTLAPVPLTMWRLAICEYPQNRSVWPLCCLL